MKFRMKIFLSLAAMVMITALLEGSLDLLANRARTVMAARSVSEVEETANALAAAIELRGEVPVLSGVRPLPDYAFRETRYRIVRDNQVIHGERRQFPETNAAWITASRSLMANMTLEVALERSPFERFLANELLVDLADLPIFLGLAFFISWLLSRAIIRPIHELTVASEQLSEQEFPEPLAVPAGGDELTRMATSFNNMSKSIHGYLERERSFTRYASHELRTPLASLRAQVESAQSGLAEPAQILPALERNVRRMEGIVTALLSLSRSQDRDEDPMPLSPLMSEILRALPGDERARVTLNGEHRTVVVTDARLVQQAITNLLDNALRHTEGAVTITLALEGKVLRVELLDEGPGLSDEVLQRRSAARSDDSSPGHGLGLSLVTQIATSLGGTFELRNTGEGLNATLTLPVVVAPDRNRGTNSFQRAD